MKNLFLSLFVLSFLVCEADAQYAPPLMPVQQQPPVQQNMYMPPVVVQPSPVPQATQPTYENMMSGFREQWVHEYRPFNQNNGYGYGYNNPECYQNQGYNYNPNTQCYQRPLSYAQPQYQQYVPSAQYYCQPQVQYYCEPRGHYNIFGGWVSQ